MGGMLFSKVLQMSLIGCYSFLVIFIVRLFLKKISYKYCYYLWMIVFVNLCVSFSLFSSFSLIPQHMMNFTTETSKDEIPDTSPEEEPSLIVFSQDGTISHQENLQDILPDHALTAMVPDGETNDAHTSTNPDYKTAESGNHFLRNDVVSMAEKLWLLGICFFAAYSIGNTIYLNKRIWSMHSSDLNRKDRIVELEGIDSPFLWGILHPTIYVPKDMEAEEQYYIIAHEKCHRRRKDYLVKIGIYAITVIHWFNPFVWVAYHLCCKDMEISCDESVLENLKENIRKDYAKSLLKYAAKQNRYVMTPLTFGEPSVRSRIENVLKFRKKSLFISVAAILLTIFVAVGLLLRPVDKKNPSEKPQETVQNPENIFHEEADSQKLPVTNNGGEVIQIGNDLFAYLYNEKPGLPCEDPSGAGWNLKQITDVRENFSQMSYVPEEGTEENVYLLGKTEHYTLYGKGDYQSMLLEYNGNYAEIQYPYTSNYMTPPDLLETDLDGDSIEELAIKFNIKHGTGVSIDTFLLADTGKDGELYVYQFLEEDFVSQLAKHLSYEKAEKGIQALVDGKPAGYFMENMEESDPFLKVSIGAQVHFYYTEGGIQISADIMFLTDEYGAIYEENNNDITADVSLTKDGKFSLTNFSSRNRNLDSQVEDAIKKLYGVNEFPHLDIRYDSTKMNEETLISIAEILVEGTDSYDYAEITMKRSKDSYPYSGWDVEEIALEK